MPLAKHLAGGDTPLNLATMQFHSRALGRHVTYTAILPTGGTGPFPVLYQLHGRSDDHTAWVVHSRLVDHVAGLPLIVVLPDGGISGWRNLSPHERYEDFITVDLLDHVQRTFHVRPGPAAIGGLSMGGGGAIRLGLKHPDLFASIWGHSSSLPTAQRMAPGASEEDTSRDDVFAIAVGLVGMSDPPRLSFDCGVDDALLQENRAFHVYLEAVGLPHTYLEHPGGHTWDYWDRHVRSAVRQHTEVLGIKRS